MTRAEFQARIAELIAQGRSPRAAEKAARRERRNAHPAHQAAAGRRWQMAQDRRRNAEVAQP